jgi:hypothetical protein
MDSATVPKSTTEISAYTTPDGLRKVVPYWYPHTTMAKERWWGREILEVVSSEFRERSLEYYVSNVRDRVAPADRVYSDMLSNRV